MKLKVGKTAIVFGLFIAFMHLVWMLMVATGIAQWYLKWILGLHLLNNPFVVLPFSFGTAVTLIVVTFIVGYLGGWVFAWIWNYLHKGQ